MNIFHLFKKKREYGDYRLSENAAKYEEIASELGNTAQHVYDIAHGEALRSYDDYVIFDRLCYDGIVHRR